MANPANNKNKGNAFEREVAKKLSRWIYGDQYILGRDPTSGARGTVLGRGQVFVGDIIPVKQLPLEWQGVFPFIIECKTGYKALMPNLNQQNIIHKWINKLVSERVGNQLNPILIVRFLRQRAVILLPLELDHTEWSICLNIYCKTMNQNIKFYVYKFEDVLKQPFDDLKTKI